MSATCQEIRRITKGNCFDPYEGYIVFEVTIFADNQGKYLWAMNLTSQAVDNKTDDKRSPASVFTKEMQHYLNELRILLTFLTSGSQPG